MAIREQLNWPTNYNDSPISAIRNVDLNKNLESMVRDIAPTA